MASSSQQYPTLNQHRPLQYERDKSYPSMMRLRHHLLLTRLKLGLQHLVSLDMTKTKMDALQHDLVRHPIHAISVDYNFSVGKRVN
jgi:hypothetical protein